VCKTRAKRGTVDSALVYKAKALGSIPGWIEKLYTLPPLAEGNGKPLRNFAKNMSLMYSRSELNCRSHITCANLVRNTGIWKREITMFGIEQKD